MRVILPATVTVSFFYLVLGVYVLRARYKETRHYLLATAAGMLFLWTFLAYFAYAAPSYRQLLIWYHLSTIGMFLYYPLNHHFVFATTRAHLPFRSNVYVIALYIPFVILFLRDLNLGVSIARFERLEFGWKFIPAAGSVWNLAWVFLASASAILSIVYMAIAARRTNLNRERCQYRFLLAALSVTLFLTLGEYLLVARVLPDWTVVLSPILQSPWVLAMVIAMERYRFMNLVPQTVTEEILRTTDEIVLLVNAEGRVVFANPRARTFAAEFRSSINGADDAGILPNSMIEILRKAATLPVRSGDKPDDDHDIAHTVFVDSRPHRLRYRPLYDRFDDPLGVLIMGSSLHSSNEARRDYRLTDRESQVLEYLMTGWTCGRIADTLDIAERTVKAHVSAIYEKTGATNRVELLNLVLTPDRKETTISTDMG